MRDKARTVISPGNALVVIMLLVAILGLSLALIVQQSMNLTALAGNDALTSSQAENAAGSEATTQSDERVDEQSDEQSDAADSPAAESHNATQDSEPQGQDASNAIAGNDTRININTATLEELQTITGVGPVTAQRIIDHRNTVGRFTSVDELMDVSGIGAKTLEKMRDQVRVE
ncbi:helix-hairpin-helix domain-containing protein [Bifidobacterium sp. LC6]|uniref:Helix-hairpin-helix domain-containing protein n=2 Tax=Bifidobacterium colobi TaxID=2809026 RepID=A0ABS5UXW0_9BIFI|nr:helix-hairpin-helix domain-containing protein [Bifidobacterium colobi]